MKRLLLILSFCLPMGAANAQTPADTTAVVPHDSIAWSANLEGVTVRAQKQFVKTSIDRTTYDVQADADSKTLSAHDMLRKVPMVGVDGQDNITVRGSSQFKIYKNGHPDPSLSKNAKDILKAMPAAMVKRIEVITAPGAREDAEGTGTILNIVTMGNSHMQGLTGAVTGSYNTLHHPNANAFLTTQWGKAVLSFDYGYGGMARKETQSQTTTTSHYKETGRLLTSTSNGTNPGNVHFVDINASYDIDSLNLLSATVGGYFYKLNVEGDATEAMTDAQGQPLYSYQSHYWMPGYSHHSWNGRADFEHKTHRKGERLTFSYMLSLTRQHTDQQTDYSDMLNTPFRYTSFLVKSRERFTEHTLQADWLRPLGKGHQVETGAKFINRQNNSHTLQTFDGADHESPQQPTDFDHVTRIYALYADYIYQARRWAARAGLRFEHSAMHGDDRTTPSSDAAPQSFSQHLNDWVPQASMKFNINDAQSLILEFTTNINRPGIQYLNPAVVYTPTTLSFGNERLASSHSQTLSLVYMLTGQRLTLQLAPAYKHLSNGIGRVRYTEGDLICTTYGNVEGLRRLQMEGYVQWKPADGTTFSLNANSWYDHLQNSDSHLRQHGWSAFYYAQFAQQLPWRLRLSLSCYGSVGHAPNNVYSYGRSWHRYSASLQRSLLRDDRLTVRLSTYMPFTRYQRTTTVFNQGDYTGYDESRQSIRMVQLSLSYRFGSLKASVKKTDTSISNNDVVGGINRKNE